MDLREVLAANLRRLRHLRGLSQDDLAYDAGVSRSYLSQIEKGKYYASLKFVGSSLSTPPWPVKRMIFEPTICVLLVPD